MVLWLYVFMFVWWSGFMVFWFYDCMVFWFYGFMVLWFYGCMVLWTYGFIVVWFYWCYGCIVLWFYGCEKYRICISLFQEDIDPISEIFKMLLNGFHHYRRPSFRKLSNFSNFKNMRSINIYFPTNIPIQFLILLFILVSPKIRIIGLERK